LADRHRLFRSGTGYFIWGGQALFGYPKAGPEVIARWDVGFLDARLLSIPYRRISHRGLTWFNVFGNAAPLYMAGVAFTVYGIHWFAMAHRRYIGRARCRMDDGDHLSLRFRPRSVCVWKGWRRSSDDHLHRSRLDLSRGSSNAAGGWNSGSRLVALLQCLTGIWLMYCTWAVTVNLALGYKVWI